MENERPWTILSLLKRTTDYFASRGIDQPRTDAEILLAHVLGLRRIDLYIQHDKPLLSGELDRYRSVVRRRADREPVAYITGEKEFWSLPLRVTPSVLIPRPDTEALVEAALAVLSRTPELAAPVVADLGTGSGAIALALASEITGGYVVAVDRSEAAVRIAEENARRNRLSSRVRFVCGSWLSMVAPEPVFDVIVSNPPYVPAADIPGLSPEISRYEPVGALDGGLSGGECFKVILREALPRLKPGGHLLLEIGFDQRPLIEALVGAAGGYSAPVFRKDHAGHDRVAEIRHT